ncbi:hypothetical protein RUM43_015014 [Polyplax serrata]|uniref:Uncharacterized protein n=1 Tax=Polyplax serrata TaxID=468196 RepID=A0AAN8NW78_POLSC
MNFDYVVQRKEKGKICFGSGLERKTFYTDTKGMVSRHARHHMKENLDVAPGLYETSHIVSAMGTLLNKPTSKLGTVLGGRKAERKFYQPQIATGARDYNLPTTFPGNFRQCCAPFNSNTYRTTKTTDYPGVGTYKVESFKRRTPFFKHSFGSKKCLQPSVKIKCGPFNFDKCERCQKYPEGDYWYLEPIVEEVVAKKMKQSDIFFLCRPCYDIEKKDNQFFTKAQIQRFKVRSIQLTEKKQTTHDYIPSFIT